MKCCICNKELPNRYAVGGYCQHPGCNAAFCRLHWRHGNHFCPTHGGKVEENINKYQHDFEQDQETANQNGSSEMTQEDEHIQENKSNRKLNGAKARKVMKETISLARKMGGGASDLVRKLKKDDSPESMIATFDESLKANAERRQNLSSKLEDLGSKLAKRKKEFAKMPPARKRIVESELRSMLAEYKAGERELSVLLENERILHQVKGRLGEMIAYGLAGVSEEAIDDVATSLEDHVLDAEGRADAARELDKSGRRREHEEDTESLWDELAAFDEESATETTDKTQPESESESAADRESPDESEAAYEQSDHDTDKKRQSEPE